jgi:hypothetical protein
MRFCGSTPSRTCLIYINRRKNMSPLVHGVMAGLIFGAATVGGMLPMKFENRRRALSAAFVNRFSIGLVIPLLKVALPAYAGWSIGLCAGALLSLSAAIITETYIPIMVLGIVGGTVIGAIA